MGIQYLDLINLYEFNQPEYEETCRKSIHALS